ncbi:MAG: hypothetical protein ACK58T_45425, partial [Phycisphaerae bacterium]
EQSLPGSNTESGFFCFVTVALATAEFQNSVNLTIKIDARLVGDRAFGANIRCALTSLEKYENEHQQSVKTGRIHGGFSGRVQESFLRGRPRHVLTVAGAIVKKRNSFGGVSANDR